MSNEVVDVAQLGRLGPVLGTGGQARVLAAPNIQLPDAPGPLVYKEYKSGQNARQGPRQLVKLRNDLDPVKRAKIDKFMAWPLRVVEGAGQVRGVLMPLIDPTFMQSRTLPGTGAHKNSVREVQNLLVPPQRAMLVGMPAATLAQRLEICRDLAAALYVLHEENLVFGDINAKNELFRLGRHPTVMLVDCDGIRKSGNVAEVAQLNSPDWDAPERWLTIYTDRYKFGLFVLRCLSTGEQISTTRDPARADAALDAAGRQLLRATLSDQPKSRPSIEEWGWYLRFRVTGKPPPKVVVLSGAGVVPSQRQSPAQPITTANGWVKDKATGKWIQL